MLIKDVAQVFENFAPLQLQESYDNSGLCIGNPAQEVKSILLTIDITEEVLDEAISLDCNLVISHHPLIFSGLKKLTGRSYTERCVIKAIQNNIAIYSAHTNFDAVYEGVNQIICQKIGLKNLRILSSARNSLLKLVTFVPVAHIEKVREALFNAGAGHIGNYDSCSFGVAGQGSFRGDENTKPFVGTKGELHFENEIRIETIFPSYLKDEVISALKTAHPYEEVAFDLYPLENKFEKVGMGMFGELESPMDEESFLKSIKNIFQAGCVKFTPLLGRKISKVAVCGGSGSFLLNTAISAGADVFISGDFKYHQYFDADKRIVIADIGHYESEQYTKELFYNLLIKNFPNFAVHFSRINTNPLNYL